MARGADVARGTSADANLPRGRAHAAHRWRTSGKDAWQGHTSPCGGMGWRHVAVREGKPVKGP